MFRPLSEISSLLIPTFPVHSISFTPNTLSPLFLRKVWLSQVVVWVLEIKLSSYLSSRVIESLMQIPALSAREKQTEPKRVTSYFGFDYVNSDWAKTCYELLWIRLC